MAIGDPYCTLAELKDYLKLKSNDTTYDDVLNDAIGTATTDIERFCGRQFNQQTSATQRVYVPATNRVCYTDDFWTTDQLVVETDPGGTGDFSILWDSTHYELYPLNGVVAGMPGWPYRKLRGLYSFYFPKWPFPAASFYGSHGTVRVTAQWGWAAVPAPVHYACLALAAANWKASSAPFGVAGSDQLGQVVHAQEPDMMLAKLRRFMRAPVKVGGS